MIAGAPIAGHPIAALLLRRGGSAVEVVTRGAWGSGQSRIKQEDEEILAVIMAFTQRERFSRH